MVTRRLSPGLSCWLLGLTESLPSLRTQALCTAVAGPNLLKNMTQLLCVEASEGEEPWSPSAIDGSSPALLPPGNPRKCPPPNNSQPQLVPWFFHGAALTKSITTA